MQTFNYRSLDKDGEVITGSLDAVDMPAAAGELHSRGLVPLDLSADGPTFWMRLNEPVAFLDKPNKREICGFLRDLARLIQAGMPVDGALKLLAGMQKKELFARMLDTIREKVRRGESLAAAMTGYRDEFPVQITAAVQAGEHAGTLADSLSSIATSMDRSLSFQERLRGALIYPAILMIMVSATFALVVTFVLPQFAPLFEGNEDKLPWATRFVMDLSAFLDAYWPFFAAAIGALVLWILAMRRDTHVRARVFRLLCSVKWLKNWLLTPDIVRFTRTVAVCNQSGMALDKAISMAVEAVQIPHVGEELMRVRAEVRRGDLLSKSLERLGWFPPLALQFTQVGEQSGKLGGMLEEAATIMAQDYEAKLEKALQLVSPILTLVMGGIVALLVGAVMLGIMSINDVAL